MLRRVLVLGSVAALALVGCDDDDHGGGHHHGDGACGAIISVCHDVDTGEGPIAECHALAHDEVEADCEPRRAECVALCEAAAAAHGDAGTHDSH